MEDLVNIKAQHPVIRDKLLKTGDKDLVECTSDNYWACGGSFRSRKVQTGVTTGQNKLGLIWTKTRQDLRTSLNQETNETEEMPELEDN